MNKTEVRYILLQFYEIKFNIDWYLKCNVLLLFYFFLFFLGFIYYDYSDGCCVLIILLILGLIGWLFFRLKIVYFKIDKIIEFWVVVFVFYF